MYTTKTSAWMGAVIAILFVVNVSLYFDFSADDAGITFRYASNLFDGLGLTYNPGERVEGYSNFGYVILVGLAYRIMTIFHEDPKPFVVLASKFINLAASMATLWLCFHYCRRILRHARWKALLVVILVASNGAFAINTTSPLETATLTFLLMLTTYLMTAYMQGYKETITSHKHEILFVISACLLSIWRIDSAALLAFLLFAMIVLKGFRLQRRYFVLAGAWFCFFALYTLARYSYFGDWFNNPYHAKVHQEIQFRLVSEYTARYFRCLGAPSWMFLSIFVMALLRSPAKYTIPFTVVIGQWIYILAVNGDWMSGYRFWAPVVPHMCMLIVGAIDWNHMRLRTKWVRISKIIAVLFIAAWWLASAQIMYNWGPRYAGKWLKEGISHPITELNCFWRTAEWINAHVPKDSVMVLSEAGYIPFLTGLYTIESYGLCNRDLARMPGDRGKLGLKIHWSHADPGTRYVLSKNPDIIVLGPTTDPVPVLIDNYQFVASPEPLMHIYARPDATILH